MAKKIVCTEPWCAEYEPPKEEKGTICTDKWCADYQGDDD